jgi:predicted ATPase/DNA-binding SARP family transcriptional activator/Tfp pilus assembly protein PilF
MLDGKSITGFATEKERALLYYLVVGSDRPHRRDTLAGLFWAEYPQKKARQNLRQTLSCLRQTIQDEQSGPFLLITRETIQFNRDSAYWLDVESFVELVAACREHRHRRISTCLPCLRRLQQAAELFRGPFLEHFFLDDSAPFEEWVLLNREWLQHQAVEALSLLADYHERRGEYRESRRYAWRQVELEPWREGAQRQLMRLLALEGERGAALAQYERCRKILSEELGVEPTLETVQLYEKIRAEEDLVPTEFRSKLPPAPTSFVGRQKETSDLAGLLADPDCRMVTLVGPGGIGKTRLTLHVAAEQVGAFAHGVYFVPLASVGSSDLLLTAIADGIAFSFYGQNPREQLLGYLREKEMLLVLDNMEHLIGGLDLVEEVLKRAPDVVLLVTSRERLNLREEWSYELEGLSFPEPGDEIGSIQSYSAIDLFVQRGRQLRPGFSVPAEDLPDVAKICQLVEGMPLGIELAVASLPIYSCEEIGLQIESNLDVLRTHLRNVPQRHQSMWATFEHSWGLLTDQERALFASMSVFRGGFDAEAARYILKASPQTLMAIMHKSLLRREASGRWQIHQLLRQYAAEKLSQVPQLEDEVRSRHARYYAGFLQECRESLRGAGQDSALARIGVEIDNVRSAWQWALAQAERGTKVDQALSVFRQSVESLYLFYTAKDWFQEGTEALAQAVAAVERIVAEDDSTREQALLLGRLLVFQGKCSGFSQHSDTVERLYEQSLEILRRIEAWEETALPLHGLGYMAHVKGSYDQARQYFQESIAVYERNQDRWGQANVLNNLCLVARRQGDFVEARDLVRQALAIRREIGDKRGVASSLSNLGLVHCSLGEYEEAMPVLEESMRIFAEMNNKVGMGNVCAGLCQAAFRLGQVDAARKYGRECLRMYREAGDYWGVAIALNNLGRMAAEQGDYAQATTLYQEAVTTYERVGVKSGLANTLGNLGEVCIEKSEYTQARVYLHRALQISCEIGAVPATLKSLVVFASLLAKEGDVVEALELLAFAVDQSAVSEDIREMARRQLARLVEELPPHIVEGAEVKGRAQSLDQVIAKIMAS